MMSGLVMIEYLGISHLFELSRTEAIAGFFTPLAVFAVFFLAQLILPGRRLPGYVINPQTGEPRSYRLNGLLVFALALVAWAFELTGMPRDWFYRSSVYAVAGGTLVAAIVTVIAVFSQPRGKVGNSILALWFGRAQELAFFKERFDVKMYLYVVGGTMLSLNALSGAAYHYELFGEDYNPGVFLYAAFFTFYILDYCIFERVQLYTYDLIHENLGFKLFWGCFVVYGWLFILPLWGMAVYPDPGFSPAWTYAWLIGTAALFLLGWGISRGANLQKYTFKRFPDRKFLGSRRAQNTSRPATGRFLYERPVGRSRATSTTWARASLPCRSPSCSAISPIPGPGPTSSSSSRCSPTVNSMTTNTARRNTARTSGRSIRRG